MGRLYACLREIIGPTTIIDSQKTLPYSFKNTELYREIRII